MPKSKKSPKPEKPLVMTRRELAKYIRAFVMSSAEPDGHETIQLVDDGISMAVYTDRVTRLCNAAVVSGVDDPRFRSKTGQSRTAAILEIIDTDIGYVPQEPAKPAKPEAMASALLRSGLKPITVTQMAEMIRDEIKHDLAGRPVSDFESTVIEWHGKHVTLLATEIESISNDCWNLYVGGRVKGTPKRIDQIGGMIIDTLQASENRRVAALAKPDTNVPKALLTLDRKQLVKHVVTLAQMTPDESKPETFESVGVLTTSSPITVGVILPPTAIADIVDTIRTYYAGRKIPKNHAKAILSMIDRSVTMYGSHIDSADARIPGETVDEDGEAEEAGAISGKRFVKKMAKLVIRCLRYQTNEHAEDAVHAHYHNLYGSFFEFNVKMHGRDSSWTKALRLRDVVATLPPVCAWWSHQVEHTDGPYEKSEIARLRNRVQKAFEAALDCSLSGEFMTR